MGYPYMQRREKLEVRAIAQQYADLAIKTLVNVMRKGETDRDRVTAAKEVLDRAYGKSVQGHHLEDPPDDSQISEEMLDRAERFTSAIASMASRTKK